MKYLLTILLTLPLIEFIQLKDDKTKVIVNNKCEFEIPSYMTTDEFYLMMMIEKYCFEEIYGK